MLSKMPFYDELTDRQRDTVNAALRTVKYEKGQTVHSHDGHCLGMICMISGKLCVSMLSDEGRELVLFRVGEGEVCVLSSACVMRQIAFDVHITAESDSEVLIVPSHIMKQLMSENKAFEGRVYKQAAEHFSDVMWTMQQVLFSGFESRLASYLIDESMSLGNDELNVTHEQIAKLVGSAREVVTRTLKRFSDKGYVSLGRGTVKITDAAALEKLIK